MPRTIHDVALDALNNGSLFGVPGYGKTLTLDGRRRYTIRVQSDVFLMLHTPELASGAWYPDLIPAITEAVEMFHR